MKHLKKRPFLRRPLCWLGYHRPVRVIEKVDWSFDRFGASGQIRKSSQRCLDCEQKIERGKGKRWKRA